MASKYSFDPYKKASFQLKKAWMRLVLKNIRYSNNHDKLDLFYTVTDPWDMSSETEQFRFMETNRIILEKFGRQGSILEVGCGEGHHSLHLSSVCDRLTGLDVSARAVTRAKNRCPDSHFILGDIFSREVSASAPFDLVVACEVFYYMRDVRLGLQRMQSLGHNYLITYFEAEIGNLDQKVLELCPSAVSETIEFRNNRWRVMCWSGSEGRPKVREDGNERVFPDSEKGPEVLNE